MKAAVTYEKDGRGIDNFGSVKSVHYGGGERAIITHEGGSTTEVTGVDFVHVYES